MGTARGKAHGSAAPNTYRWNRTSMNTLCKQGTTLGRMDMFNLLFIIFFAAQTYAEFHSDFSDFSYISAKS